MELRMAALKALQVCDPAAKAAAALALHPQHHAGLMDDEAGLLCTQADLQSELPADSSLPGRTARPELVNPRLLKPRSPFTNEGRAALLHAVAHIELNAINLALDAVWRFAGMPPAYYRDWLRVAAEEALHFTLLNEYLATLGHHYGDWPAHDGLWAMTARTAGDITARMALVPRTLEARGLDATPPMQARLRQAGDERAVEILDVILRDEIGHVAIGNTWYRWLCARQGLDPVAHYAVLAVQYGAPRLRGPFNLEARSAAGFTAAEIAALGAA